MTRKLSIRMYLAILAVGALAFSALAVALPHDPYIRWQSFKGTMFEPTKYIYERLHFDPAPVDVVFIGSSRTETGANPLLLKQDLARRGLDLNIVNMSLPASGMDIRVAEAREALRAHPEIKLLVIATVEAFPRDGHQAFGDLGTTYDILTSPWLVNRNLPASIMKLPMRQMKLAAATLLPEAFGYQAQFDPARYPGSTITNEDVPGWQPIEPEDPYRSEAHARALAAESVRRKAEMTPPVLPDDMAWIEFGVSRSSMDELTRLAKANGTRIVFLFLPFYEGYEEPAEADWLRERGPLWSAEWMRFDPSNYRDAAHASPLVVPKLNEWLADRIAGELGKPETSATTGSN